MKKFFSILVVALVAIAAFSTVSCKKEDDSKVTNTMTVRGSTYKIVHAICAIQNGFVHMDVDTENGVLHGYGGFEEELIGKTTDFKGKDFFLSFNPQSGPSIDPVIKSGTVKITKVEGGLNVKVDCVEDGFGAFTMDFFAEDMGQNF